MRRRALVANGEDVVLSHQAALDLLGPGDVAMLRMLAIDAQRRGATLDLSLESGRAVTAEVGPVTGADAARCSTSSRSTRNALGP